MNLYKITYKYRIHTIGWLHEEMFVGAETFDQVALTAPQITPKDSLVLSIGLESQNLRILTGTWNANNS